MACIQVATLGIVLALLLAISVIRVGQYTLTKVFVADEGRHGVGVEGKVGLAPVAAGAAELKRLRITVVASGRSAQLWARLLLSQTPVV